MKMMMNYRVKQNAILTGLAATVAAASCALAPNTLAQSGDRPGEEQAPPPATLQIPPAPPLLPSDALKTFELPPGFRIELVASEPLIETPIAMEFGPDGAIWVVEMRGFMPNVEGKGEDQPVGRISVLRDEDGDGVMDKSTVFLDGLVMPRAIGLVNGGALVAEPPHLWFCKDTDGDGVADQKTEVSGNYGSQANPEHTSNGLMWALDNWIYSANHTERYRWTGGDWETDKTIFRGQWGITQDNYGRLFYNSNSDQFRGDLVPAHYLSRNPNFDRAGGANARIASDQTVWPSRVNPGINRGYQSQMLRDGKLSRFTAACGPGIYRGANFPAEFLGNGFVCEPSGNLIRRNVIIEEEAVLTAENPYDKAEFLTSTDERFRPVNAYNGPDGALYIVDMYRGILQHRIYLTTFLRNQILDRDLDKPINLGRIYKVVYEGAPLDKPEDLSRRSTDDLVAALSSPNGWVRDTAQRLLVEGQDPGATRALRRVVTRSGDSLAQLHALWTLDGLGALNPRTLSAALRAEDPKVRAAGIRLSEPFFREGARIYQQVLRLTEDPTAEVQLQLAFSLGEHLTPESLNALEGIVTKHAYHRFIRDAVITSLGGHELEFLNRLAENSAWAEKEQGREALFQDLARCVVKEGRGERILQMLAMIDSSGAQDWQKNAMLDGVAGLVPQPRRGQPPPKINEVALPEQPSLLQGSENAENENRKGQIDKLAKLFTWPGKAPSEPRETARSLTTEEQKLFEEGKIMYLAVCGACHQPHGKGQEGLAPPLLDSPWAVGSKDRLIRISLQGVRGPITVHDKVWELEMPGLAILSDEQLASALTYIRREWGHEADPVLPNEVQKVREATAGREDSWSEEELLSIE